MAELLVVRDGDVPLYPVVVVPPGPDRSGPGRSVWDGGGYLLGTGLAVLFGRTTSDPDALRRSAAAALAMARMMECGS